LQYIIFRGKLQCGGTNSSKLNTLTRRGSHGGSLKIIFKRNTCQEHYYDKKMQEFFELKLGSMTMEEYESKFLELLSYVGFIKDEKVKIQIFSSGLPSFYSDKIHFDEPKTLEEAIRKTEYLYEQKKGRSSFQKAWDDKKKGTM
jgi:hypothetical protein